MNTARQIGSFPSSVAFGYSFGSYDHALLPLAFMLIVSGPIFALIKPYGVPQTGLISAISSNG